MAPLIEQHREQIVELCRKYGVKKLELFGSAVRGEDFDASTSDVDFFYDFDDQREGLADRYFGLIEDLESLLGRRVDLVSACDVENPFFLRSANRSRILLYAA